MKAIFLIAASLIVGTAAIAQTTNPDPSASAPTTQPGMAAPATPDMAPPPAPAPADPGAAAPMSPPADTAAPTPMSPPADTTAAASTDTSNYPACSRTVHDKCVQKGMMKHKRR